MNRESTSEPRNQEKTRKPYRKPSMERVRLVLEEAVLGKSCKLTELDMGPSGYCLEPSPCAAEGLGS